MRVSRGPGRQRSQSSPASLKANPSLCSALLCTSSHTVSLSLSQTHTHTWLCSHGASVSVIAACHPYLSTSVSPTPSLRCRLSPLLRDVLPLHFPPFPSFLRQIKRGPARPSPRHHTQFLTPLLISGLHACRLLNYPHSPSSSSSFSHTCKKKKSLYIYIFLLLCRIRYLKEG